MSVGELPLTSDRPRLLSVPLFPALTSFFPPFLGSTAASFRRLQRGFGGGGTSRPSAPLRAGEAEIPEETRLLLRSQSTRAHGRSGARLRARRERTDTPPNPLLPPPGRAGAREPGVNRRSKYPFHTSDTRFKHKPRVSVSPSGVRTDAPTRLKEETLLLHFNILIKMGVFRVFFLNFV